MQDALVLARQAATRGDVDRAEQFYEQALHNIELSADKNQLIKVMGEYIEFLESERSDRKLLTVIARFMELVCSDWAPQDVRYLPYIDHLCRAHYRLQSFAELERDIKRGLELQKQISGQKSAAYADRLQYAANLLADAGKKDLVSQFKAECHRIRDELAHETKPAPPPQGRMLMAERKVSLGLLLSQAGILPPAAFMEHMQASRQLGVPIGDVLEHAGVLTHEQVYAVLQAQELVRLNKLTMDEAVESFALVHKEGISLETAIARLKFDHDHNPCMNRLGALLQSAGILSETALNDAVAKAESQDMQLARYLVLHALVPATIVAQAQEMQNYIENGSISRDLAVQRLKNSAAQRSSGMSLRQMYKS